MNLDELLRTRKKYIKYPLYADVVNHLKEKSICEVILFGASESGKDIFDKLAMDSINVIAFCDNNPQKWGNRFLDKKIISPSALRKTDVVLISSSFQDEIYSQLRGLGIHNIFNFPLIDVIGREHYDDEIIYNSKGPLTELFCLLADDKSKKVLTNIIAYRLTNDLTFIKEITEPNNQYFPEIVELHEDEVFVDIGAYTGDTLIEFVKKNPKFFSAIAFEPDDSNYKTLIDVARCDKRIECYKLVVYDENKQVSFIAKDDCSSVIDLRLSCKGTKIESITLDDFFKDRISPTYIKMDVEGTEAKVIKGGKLTIAKHLPSLAVSVYHRHDDLWRIPEILNSITQGYEYYLRHHSHNICDTVLYCLSKNRAKKKINIKIQESIMGKNKMEENAAKLRKHIITMNCHAGSGHPGGALSAVEIITYLFEKEINFSPENRLNENRDRFILSKGHACMVLYAALMEKGFFDSAAFRSLRHVGGNLQGHPDRLKTPGVEFNSGSLGQGFSFALGCALGAKRKNMSFRTYVLLGDGELNEGQIWEGMMFGAHWMLDNIVAIVDYNKYQSDDLNTNITALEPLMDKFKAFGWQAIEIDGHDYREIGNALDRAKKIKRRPTIILAHTVKGRGISFMENNPKWHGSMAPQGQERECALKECGCEGLEL